MPELSLLMPMLAMLLAIGAFAGVLAGLLGVGGGIILVPAFYFAFSYLGFDGPQLMQVCIGTSLATIIVTSVRSVLAHNRKGAVDWDILRGWAPGIAIGAVLGVLVVAQLRTVALQAIFGSLALVVAFYLGFGRAQWRLGPAMPKGVARAGLSPAVGFLSVLMGIGGGSFGVPLMSLYGVAIHRAVATAAGFGVVIAVPSVAGFLLMDIEGAPPLSVGRGERACVRCHHRDDVADRTLGGKAGPCDGPQAAEAGIRGVSGAGGAEHAAQGGRVIGHLRRRGLFGRVFPTQPCGASTPALTQQRRAGGQFGHDPGAGFRRHLRPGGDLVDGAQAADADPFHRMHGAKFYAGAVHLGPPPDFVVHCARLICPIRSSIPCRIYPAATWSIT